MPFKELASGSIDPSFRLRQLHILLVLALAGGVLLSPLLWFGVGRTFPRAPIFFTFSRVPILIDSSLTILVFAALAFSVFSKRPQQYLVLAVALIVFLAALDQTRLQPWVFQYAVMLSVFAFRRESFNATSLEIRAQQLVIVSLYFWSGAQKINWSFSHDVIPSLLQSTGISLAQVFLPYLPVIGFVIAAVEMSIGVGLAVRRTRRTAAILAIGMHAVVLVILIASRSNSVVWPWNIAMAAMVGVLFFGTKNPIVDRDLFGWRRSDYLARLIFVVCGIAPALSFVGWWDLYLSAALYTGTSPIGVIRVSESVRDRLPQKARQQMFTTGKGELVLPFYEWCMSELNVPPYPEPRAYRQIARQICEYSDDAALIIKSRPSPIDGNYVVSATTCPELFAR
jgi:hypothetical protein